MATSDEELYDEDTYVVTYPLWYPNRMVSSLLGVPTMPAPTEEGQAVPIFSDRDLVDRFIALPYEASAECVPKTLPTRSTLIKFLEDCKLLGFTHAVVDPAFIGDGIKGHYKTIDEMIAIFRPVEGN